MKSNANCTSFFCYCYCVSRKCKTLFIPLFPRSEKKKKKKIILLQGSTFLKLSKEVMGRSRAPPPRAKAPTPPPRPAPRPTAAAPPKPSAPPPAPVGGAQHHHPQAPPPPMGGTPMVAPSGPGLLGTMAASAAGSLAGNYIAHQMFGGSAPRNSEEVQQMSKAMTPNDPCRDYFATYSKCLENEGAAGNCQWAWDLVNKCRTDNHLI